MAGQLMHAGMDDQWCAYHHRCEPIRWRLPGNRICGECWHWFRSGLHLRAAHLRTCWRVFRGDPHRWRFTLWSLWHSIHCCPHCSHDF